MRFASDAQSYLVLSLTTVPAVKISPGVTQKMKHLLKALALGAALSAIAPLAHADTLTGTIFMSSSNGVTETMSTSGIQFIIAVTSPNQLTTDGTSYSFHGANATGGTGNFSTVGAAVSDPVTIFTNSSAQILFSSINATKGTKIFTFVDATNTYTFLATSYSVLQDGTVAAASDEFFGTLYEVNSALAADWHWCRKLHHHEDDHRNHGSRLLCSGQQRHLRDPRAEQPRSPRNRSHERCRHDGSSSPHLVVQTL